MPARISRRVLLGGSVVAAAPGAARSAAAAQEPGGSSRAEPAFVEHRLALQLSDRDPHHQALVLSVANNILKFYGLDLVAIEVVAFGPGIDLLRADSPNRSGVDSLIVQGVRFDVCMNTVDTIARETGKAPALNEKAVPVEAGVAQLMSLAESGYTIVRP